MTKETVAPEEQQGQPAVVIQNSDLPELQPKVTPVINQGNARKVTGLVELELGKETGAQVSGRHELCSTRGLHQ